MTALRWIRAFFCALLDHPRGMVFTAGGFFCQSCVRDLTRQEKP